MNDDQTTQEPEQNDDTSDQVQALVGLAAFQPDETCWVFIDPRSLAQDEPPVYECDIDYVHIRTRHESGRHPKVEVEYTVSIMCSLDSPFTRKEGEVFRTREEALRFGTAVVEERAVKAEEKAKVLREIADMTKAA